MSGPVEKTLAAYSDSGMRETVRILDAARQPKNLEGWEVHASAVATVFDAAEALTITADIPDRASGDIVLSIDPAAVAALFPEGDAALQKTLTWTLLAKPYGTYKVKLAGGTLQILRGAGRW